MKTIKFKWQATDKDLANLKRLAAAANCPTIDALFKLLIAGGLEVLTASLAKETAREVDLPTAS